MFSDIEFSLSGYCRTVGHLTDSGYTVRDYLDAEPEAAHLILRHDVDMSLEAAVAMAEAEATRGWAATYFVLIRSDFYNPLSSSASTEIRKLVALGHDVGLHFDPAAFPGASSDQLDRAAAAECALLESLTERPVRIISFHRPPSEFLGLDRLLAGRPQTYQPRFFQLMGYCSDSRGAWHHGHPWAHPALASRKALQLLTHPLWWTMGGELDVIEKLDRFLGNRYRHLQLELARNCEPYRDVVAGLDAPPSKSSVEE